MKKIFYIFCVLFVFGIFSNMFASPAKGSADYYIQNSQKYLDSNVRIFVVDVKASARIAQEGYLPFVATTTSGKIFLLVPQKSVKNFSANAPKLGEDGKVRNTKSYSGIFQKVKIGDEVVWGLILK